MESTASLRELDAEATRLVRLLLSRFIGEMRGMRTYTYPLGQVAAAVMEHCLPVVPAGSQAIKRLGIKPRELDDRWALARRQSRLLPDPILVEFVPADLWPGVSWIIDAGPHVAWDRFEAIALAWARGLNEDGTGRQGWRRDRNLRSQPIPLGPLSEGSLDITLTALNTLSWHLIELQKLGAAGLIASAKPLELWTEARLPKRPRAADLGARPANADRSAPPLLLIRRVLRALDTEVQQRANKKRGRETSFCWIRDRALLGVMASLGGRRRTIANLRQRDFLRDHVFPDGVVGPAVVLTLGEGVKGQGARRVKGLPPLVGQWLEEYLAYIKVGSDEADAPLWYANDANKIEAREAWETESLDKHVPKLIARYDEKSRNYSSHTLRHLAAQLAEFYGNEWLAEHREELLFKTTSGMPSSAITFADILEDHDLSSVADIYRGLNSERSREEWSRIVAIGCWAYLWEDRGARQGPDRERRRQAQRDLQTAIERRDGLEERLNRLAVDKESRRQRAIADSEGLSTAQLFVAMLELDSLNDEIIRVSELAASARAAVAASEREVRDAVDARVPVPDELPDEEIWRDVDESVAPENKNTERQPVRDWCTVSEFRAAFGEGLLPVSTLYRWLAGRLPHPNGDRRNMFRLNEDGKPTALYVISEKKRRILLDELNWYAIHVDVRERLEELRFSPGPRGR
jgi:hypothetical protein